MQNFRTLEFQNAYVRLCLLDIHPRLLCWDQYWATMMGMKFPLRSFAKSAQTSFPEHSSTPRQCFLSCATNTPIWHTGHSSKNWALINLSERMFRFPTATPTETVGVEAEAAESKYAFGGGSMRCGSRSIDPPFGAYFQSASSVTELHNAYVRLCLNSADLLSGA